VRIGTRRRPSSSAASASHRGGTSEHRPRPDGNLWFADGGPTKAIGRIGAGAPTALLAPPTLSGAGRAGSHESCQSAQWSIWAGVGPSGGLYPFDSYQWLLDGIPIAGQTAQSYTPVTGDVGHQLACRQTVTYPLPLLVTTSATGAAIRVQPAITVPPTPALSRLRVSPSQFTLTGRLVAHHCRALTHVNRHNRRCTCSISLTLSNSLNTSATVTLMFERLAPGRKVAGRCVEPTKKNRKKRSCTLSIVVHGSVTHASTAGSNSLRFNGQVGGHTLGPGTYQLTVNRAAGGGVGKRQHTTFKIVR
jgi:hypothetical protein